ncbi:CocE/NonD family hydrolase C-terminal non-catalytic domain-containing protein [Streptomyces sp. DG2A-72]|uniref:CocE/NonD family hydrolase C-terminal non-catalytic domain-containing protein n=1 Tax=Streptomyces sp. DG2A-72 TaxID=3051386 RepID=UPI00265B9716|nr:CocE/NonD family hydrolase C-terminal non-catalytic domain-containing protein [Streptomyces sp. DG2A-72]MDO0931139.1 CocE/NonD family hydrolase C-terminal non-catalytic domain-containing protein [Streptomyces sp. DG2A-72]
MPGARITSYEIPGPGVGTGRHQWDAWPPRGAHTLTLALRGDGSLGTALGTRGEAAFEVNTSIEAPQSHQQLTFSTGALRRDLVLAGDAGVSLRASFTATDGNIAAVLYDETPDGTRTRITAGWLKAGHRHGHTALVPVTPGAFHGLDVHIWPTHYRIAAGHRLVLRISSDDYPEIDSDVPTCRVALEVGSHGSAVRLTVRAAGRTS